MAVLWLNPARPNKSLAILSMSEQRNLFGGWRWRKQHRHTRITESASLFMADLNQRTAKNAPGKFYVDNHCLAHDVCRQLAPKNFACDEENGCFYVCKQPDSPE